MIIIEVIILLLSFCHVSFTQNDTDSSDNPKNRIIGGKSCKREKNVFTDFMVGLTTSHGTLFCGGSLLNENWVLTAAHCEKENIYVVHSSATDGCRSGTGLFPTRRCGSVWVKKFVKHPDFDKFILVNDIALLHLYSPIKSNAKVKYINLPNLKEKSELSTMYNEVVVMGWGAKKASGPPVISEDLQCVHVKIMNNTECAKELFLYEPDTVICTEPNTEKDSCYGDSGGPMISNKKLIGIVSWGIECASDFPAVYTRVDSYIGFIIKEMRNHSQTNYICFSVIMSIIIISNAINICL